MESLLLLLLLSVSVSALLLGSFKSKYVKIDILPVKAKQLLVMAKQEQMVSEEQVMGKLRMAKNYCGSLKRGISKHGQA